MRMKILKMLEAFNFQMPRQVIDEEDDQVPRQVIDEEDDQVPRTWMLVT